MSLLRVDNIQNRFLNGGPIIVGLTTIAGNLICSGITSITDGLVVSAATTSNTLNVVNNSTFGGAINVTSGSIVVSTGNIVVSSGNYQGDGEQLTGIVTTLVAGAGVNLTATEGTGKGQVTITVPSAEASGYANTAGIATNLKGGEAGVIPFQTAADETSFTGVGTAGYILMATGAAQPNWVEFASIKVGYADSAGISTNVEGGAAGQLVFQSNVDETSFTDAGGTNQILRSQGSLGPNYIDQANISAGFATFSGVSTSVIGGIASISQLNVGPGIATFTGIATFSESITVVKNVVIGAGLTVGGGATISGVTTFTNNVFVDGNLSVTGDLTFDELEAKNAVVSGITTLSTLKVSGVTTTQHLEVTGISTLSTLNVTGVTTTQDLLVTGVTTFLGDVNIGQGVTITNPTLDDAFLTGITTIVNLQVSGGSSLSGITTISELIVSVGASMGGVTSITNLTVSDGADFSGITTTQNLIVSAGASITGVATFGSNVNIDNNLNVDGNVDIAGTTIFSTDVGIGTTNPTGAADPNNTTVLNAGIVTAVKFYGDGSGLTNLDGVTIPNVLYVNKSGDDSNPGTSQGEAKLTIKAALAVAEKGTTIRVAAGRYVEQNPLEMPVECTITGDSLREVSIVPNDIDADLIYVTQSSYVTDVSFEGVLNPDKAVIAFNPDKPQYITRGPYIRNCTNFVRDSIGLKVDGSAALGDTKAMNVDSYTQYNQGGIGVSISNDGYAQLVSIFTICNDQSIVCNSGGQCDLTNSNSSFGRLGLVADGIGAQNWVGIITSTVQEDANQFIVDLNTPTLSVENAVYDNSTGLTTITTFVDHGFNIGQSVQIAGLAFTCTPFTNTFVSGISSGFVEGGVANRFTAGAGSTYTPVSGLLELNIGAHSLTAHADFTADTGTAYNPSTGILTVVKSAPHGMTTGTYVNLETDSLTFTCDLDGNSSNKTYPRSTDPINNLWTQAVVVNNTTFTLDVGKSTDLSTHTFVSGAANGVKRAGSLVSLVGGAVTFTCDSDSNATNHAYPRAKDLAFNQIFGLESVTGNTITLDVGTSPDTSTHFFVSGTADGVINRSQPDKFNAITGSSYDDPTGDLVVDVGVAHGMSAATALTAGAGTTYDPVTGLLTVVTTASHGLSTGDLVKIKAGAITFSCAQDNNATNHAYPRASDPTFNQWNQVTISNATTFTINVGATSTGNFAHTFVSATAGGVLRANNYVNIVDGAFTVTCTKDQNTLEKAYPTNTDPQSNKMVGVEAVTADTFTLNVNPGNLATFPDNYGNIFTVNDIVGPGLTSFTAYVGVSTLESGYDSGGYCLTYISRPYDGQVVYLDELYSTVSGITITDGGSGYTSPPTVTIDAPTESWGIRATAVANIQNGSVTGIDMVSNGRGYSSIPSVVISGSATGTATTLPTYYVVARSTEISGGISTVTVTENIPYSVGVGSTVPFFRQSRSLTSSHAFEYIGSGNTIGIAIPSRGGTVIPENEIVNLNGGLVVFTSTDQAGNFRIGEGVTINQQDGSITGEAYTRSLFANVTPIILALGGGIE